jgi:hypothetical protein
MLYDIFFSNNGRPSVHVFWFDLLPDSDWSVVNRIALKGQDGIQLRVQGRCIPPKG